MKYLIQTKIPLDVKNIDGTILSKDCFLGKDIADKINNGLMLGELGQHNSFEVSMNNVTHNIVNYEIIDDIYSSDLLVSASIMTTHAGDRVKDMIKDGARFRLSPRGKIKYNKNGVIVVCKLLTFDLILINKPIHFSEI